MKYSNLIQQGRKYNFLSTLIETIIDKKDKDKILQFEVHNSILTLPEY